MIGCDAVDCAVQQTFDQGCAVFSAAQWRVHFVDGSIRWDGTIDQNQVMWCDFGSDMDPSALGITDDAYALFCGNVADMVMTACRFRQKHVAGDLGGFRNAQNARQIQFVGTGAFVHHASEQQRIVFCMRNKSDVILCGFLHCQIHRSSCLDTYTIVSESESAGFQ